MMKTKKGMNRAGLLQLVTFCTILMAWGGCTEIISPDISTKSLTINSPSDSLYTAEDVISFWWESDTEIERYHLRITKGNAGNVILLVDTTMIDNAISYDLDPDAKYDWQIRGENEGSETTWESRTLFIDQTNPEKATATKMNGDTLSGSGPDTLRWVSNDYPLAGFVFPTRDSLVIYRRNDSTQVGAKFFFDAGVTREQIITSSSPAPINGPGMYWWKVVSIDMAGNKATSDFFKFVVN